ncbi:IS5 family transposase [Flagellimonas halotolerans]|uniref:IS5 family transposase n=1 Tax=Flagellimonas halotolerans TaxID=3112164 RepID=A0ABU6IP32_9FLAO|nr:MULTISPECIES: IS5 family transposase [unclassified Allomuricauda]MEC3964803.1 IS5 family transposase [Muricauda sp. SYSU M86414]MEC4264833.1 IS5 family transposase [Muricauda sp. SYSU M84420]
MYSVLDKDMIEMEIVPFIPRTKRGFPPTVPLGEIVNAILYKLKTGVQWNQLPVRALFSGRALSWQSVYHHYRKWCLSGTWKDCWTKFMSRHRAELDLSSVDLDGSHTPAIRGGHSVEYQGRKKRKTTNALYLTDRQGLPLAMSEPVAGNHNDLYDIEVQFEVVTGTLEQADITVEGLFLNADAGFDSKDFRSSCANKEINANVCFNKRNGNTDRDEYFDKELYDQRYAVERTNAWMDSFRSLLNRFDTTVESWKGFNYLAFIVIALKKFNRKKKKKV